MRVTRVRQKAGREERKEKRKGRGKTGERRAGTGSAEGHTLLGKQPGLSRGAEAGGWSRGVPGSLPAERGTRQQAEPPGRSCPAHITSSHKITSLCQHHCSTSLVLLQQHQQRVGRGVWGAGTTESTFLHLRANTSRGADGSLAARIPRLPGLQAEGTESSCSGTVATSPEWFAGLRAARKGKAARQSPATHAVQTTRKEASPKVLALEQRGRTVPFLWEAG